MIKNFKKSPLKMMVMVLAYTCSSNTFSMTHRIAKPLSSTAKIIAPAVIKRQMSQSTHNNPDHSMVQSTNSGIASYYNINNRFEIDVNSIMTPKRSALLLQQGSILALYKNYEDELHQGDPGINRSIDPALKNKNPFDHCRVVHAKYKDLYAQQHPTLHKEIIKYHEERYPLIQKDLQIDQHPWNDRTRLPHAYEDTYKDYTAHPEFPACMDSYYNVSKAINAIELSAESVAPMVHLRNYIYDYVQQNDSKKSYALRSVTFNKPNNNGRPEPVASYNPNTKGLNFSSRLFFDNQCKTEQALNVMHEVEHASQDPWLHWYPAEQQAEMQSVQECPCKICLKVKSAVSKGDRLPEPYFTSEQFGKFAEQTNLRCKAHREHDTTALEDALQRDNKSVIRGLDNNMGSMYDRLPIIRSRAKKD
jgi:hypothetical protein